LWVLSSEGRRDGGATGRVVRNGADAALTTDELEVADTGIGIRDSSQQRIFDAFEQEETDAATRDNGIGLGLTVTKRLVDLMGGAFRSRVQRGKERR
jgi:signal transduction histidine kinase